MFFTERGREILERVDLLSKELEGPDVPGEGYLVKVGRLRSARFSVQTQALRELLPVSERDEQEELEEQAQGPELPEGPTPTTGARAFWPSSTPPPMPGWMSVAMSPDHPRYRELDEDLGLRRA